MREGAKRCSKQSSRLHGQTEHEQMIEAIATPVHVDVREALPDEPLAVSLDEASAGGGQIALLEDRVTQMTAMTARGWRHTG